MENLCKFINSTERIDSSAKVREFFDLLIQAKVNFHPDDDFNCYVNLITGERTFTDDIAERLNDLMWQCSAFCGQEDLDIYELALNAFRKNFKA